MKKFRFVTLLLALCLAAALFPVSALALDDPGITANAAVVMDAENGEVYYEKNADTRVEPASTTKMMTAMLVVEAVERGEIGMNDIVTAYDDCQYNLDEESSNADPIIEPGETMTVQDLLYCTILVSANEACNILAEYVSGSIDAFVQEMNDRAAELGCTGTHFNNANGLEDGNHYTTARDFALIAKEAITHGQLMDICGTLTYDVAATNVNEERLLENTNSLIDPSSDYYYSDAYGIKTGFFTDAGYCLVSAAARDNINVVCAVFGSVNKGDNFADTVTLYDWLFENFSYHSILSSTETLYTVPVELGITDSTGLRADNDISVVLSNEEEASVQYQVTLYNEQENTTLQAPISAGDVLGEVAAVELDGSGNVVRTYGTAYLVATNSVEMARGVYIRTQIAELFRTPAVRRIITVLIVVLALYLVLVVFYRIQRHRHVVSVRMAKRERAERLAQQEFGDLDLPDMSRPDPTVGYFDNAPSSQVDWTQQPQQQAWDTASRPQQPQQSRDPAPQPAQPGQDEWDMSPVPQQQTGVSSWDSVWSQPSQPQQPSQPSAPKTGMGRPDDFFDSFFDD